MKQTYTLLLSILTVIFLSGCVNQRIENNVIENVPSNQQSKIEPGTKEYYEIFREKCEGSNCCLSSVNNAEQAHSLIYEENNLDDVVCPDGFTPDMSKCTDSYKWCISVNNK